MLNMILIYVLKSMNFWRQYEGAVKGAIEGGNMKIRDKVQLKTDGRKDVLEVEDMQTVDGKTLVKVSWLGRVLDMVFNAEDLEVVG